jgi:mannosyltransferase
VETVVDGTTGLLVPPADKDALSAAMIRLLKSPETMRSLGDAGRNRVTKEFSLDATVRETEQLYATLLDERGRCAA